MLLDCTKCGKQDYHVLDLEKNEVFCVVCGEQIDFPRTTKVVLESKRQIRKKSTSGFQIECKKCGTVGNPYLEKMSPQITTTHCRNCDAVVDVPASTVQAMKEMGDRYSKKKTDKKEKKGPGLNRGVIRRGN